VKRNVERWKEAAGARRRFNPIDRLARANALLARGRQGGADGGERGRARRVVADRRLQPSQSVKVPAEALLRVFPSSPRPLLARLVSSHSTLAVHVLVLAMTIDPTLSTDVRELAPAGTYRRWLGISSGPAGYKQMDRTLGLVQRHQREWLEETHAFSASGAATGHAAWARREVRALQRGTASVPAGLWINGWHTALSKDGLAWALAACAVGARPRDAMRERLFAFTNHVTDKSDAGDLVADPSLVGLDAWTVLALQQLTYHWSDAFTMLNPTPGELAHLVLLSTVRVKDRSPGQPHTQSAPIFLTNTRIRVPEVSEDTLSGYTFKDLRWHRFKSATTTTKNGRTYITLEAKQGSPREIEIADLAGAVLFCELANDAGRRP
jgi:hypothetical protein